MSETPVAVPVREQMPDDDVAGDARRAAFLRTIDEKLQQGFEVESQSDFRAMLVMKGRRKRFGTSAGNVIRTEIWIDEDGSPRTRGV